MNTGEWTEVEDLVVGDVIMTDPGFNDEKWIVESVEGEVTIRSLEDGEEGGLPPDIVVFVLDQEAKS